MIAERTQCACADVCGVSSDHASDNAPLQVLEPGSISLVVHGTVTDFLNVLWQYSHSRSLVAGCGGQVSLATPDRRTAMVNSIGLPRIAASDSRSQATTRSAVSRRSPAFARMEADSG